MPLRANAIWMALGFLLHCGTLPAQPKAVQLDSLLQSFHRNGQFTGSVLVAEGSNVLYKRGFGKADVAANVPNQPNTVFFIASLTKPFTALLVMQLLEAGQLKLDNPLAAYFPGLKNEAVRNVTIGQLLSHTSGIPDFIGPGLVPAGGLTDAWLTEQLNKTTPEPVPAGKFTYANSTYIVLAHLVEKTLGKPYARILKEKVFDKCGMTQSGSLVAGQQLGRRAKGYTREGAVLTEARFLDPAVFQGAGSVYSTVEDLFKFDQALRSDALVSKKSSALMSGSSTGYGYGWFIRQVPGLGKAVYHEGGIPGYNGLLFRVIERNYTVVLLSNQDADGAYMQPLTKSIISVLMQQQ